MTNLKTLAALAVFSVVLTACGPSAPTGAPTVSAEITTAQVTRRDLPETVTSFGTVVFDAAGQQTLSAEIEARVLDLQARAGERVSAGDAVLRLEPSSAVSTELTRARNDLVAARAEAARTRRLREDGLASDGDVERTENQRRNLEAQVSSLEMRSRRIAEMTAPDDGVVDTLFVEPGDLVSSGQALVRLSSLDRMLAAVQLEIEDVSRVRPGDTVHLSALDNSGSSIDTTIQLVDIRVDPASRTTTVYVDLTGQSNFLPGQAVRAEITAETHPAALTVPREALLYDETGPFVFTILEDTAYLRRVEVGVTTNALAEITSGLDESETIAVAGVAILSDGMKVRTSADDVAAQ